MRGAKRLDSWPALARLVRDKPDPRAAIIPLGAQLRAECSVMSRLLEIWYLPYPILNNPGTGRCRAGLEIMVKAVYVESGVRIELSPFRALGMNPDFALLAVDEAGSIGNSLSFT